MVPPEHCSLDGLILLYVAHRVATSLSPCDCQRGDAVKPNILEFAGMGREGISATCRLTHRCCPWWFWRGGHSGCGEVWM